METAELLRQCIYDYFNAWNRADAKAVAAFFSPDAVYIDTALNKEYRGLEIEKYVAEMLSGSIGQVQFSIIEEPIINGDIVFLQSSLKIHSEKETQQLESAELIKFKDKHIVMIQTYYNLNEHLEAQLQDKEIDKYAKSGLEQKQIQSIKNRLEKIMQEHRPYRDSSLKLQDLAELLDIRRNHLSQILNHEYQMKFFDFINHYRLQAFLKSLHKKPIEEINITELAYDAGFSSSSVFYKIFKRYQDISPRQYLKNIQKS